MLQGKVKREGSDSMDYLLLATGHVHNWKDGLALISFGSLFLFISVLEIMQRKRTNSGIGSVGTWLGRVFVIMVWLLMIFAGVTYLGRP